MYEDISDALQRAGFAVLRYDKRGARRDDKPANQTYSYSYEDLVDDLIRITQAAQSESNTAFKELMLVAHSEGSVVALSAAKQLRPTQFILLSPLPYKYEQLIDEQAARTPQQQTIAFAFKNTRLVQSMNDVDPVNILTDRCKDYKFLIVHGTDDKTITQLDMRVFKERVSSCASLTWMEFGGLDHHFFRVPASWPGKQQGFIPVFSVDNAMLQVIISWITANE